MRRRGILTNAATPHRPQTNSVAERAVRMVLEGTRAVLLPSGLPYRRWADAARCSCFLRHVKDPADEDFTPYQLRRTSEFKGRLVQFGPMVQYKPSAKMEGGTIKMFDSRMVPGSFIEYYLHAGGRRSGDHLALDAEAW